MLVKSIDVFTYMKIENKLHDLLGKSVKDVDESNVMHLVTDNGSNYVIAD